jgi:hypothetical protein
MSRYYVGISEDRYEVFEWDERREPTPATTGYDEIRGPYKTLEEANEVARSRD